jgi:hypothetical protein
MAKTPIEMILDGVVEWRVVQQSDTPDPIEDNLPYATHSGVLKIGDYSLRCYRLSNGQAVFNADDFEKFFSEIISGDEATNG